MLGRKTLLTLLIVAATAGATEICTKDAEAGPRGQPTDWNRFFYYPYVYYPHNFQRSDQQFNHLYHRYPPHRRIPVYNKKWHNFYPTERKYHRGHHFILDVF